MGPSLGDHGAVIFRGELVAAELVQRAAPREQRQLLRLVGALRLRSLVRVRIRVRARVRARVRVRVKVRVSWFGSRLAELDRSLQVG